MQFDTFKNELCMYKYKKKISMHLHHQGSTG